MSAWETVVGLEVHAQLMTKSKIFSAAKTAYGAEPNTQVNEVDAALPGVLPVLNRQVVELAMRAGFALGCQVQPWSQFARKNYFYADLPKGYQISQFDHPICLGGKVSFVLGEEVRTCNLVRIHLEEDAGKSTHEGRHSLVDLNRAGVPLIEIVAEPELRSGQEAAAYLKALRSLLRYLDVCDGNLEEGSFRCDANVSVRRPGEPLGTRTEIKNLNSFRFVQKAIEYEASRQIDLLETGGNVVQETRLYNADTGRTRSMRTKEEAHDYRYFPDPDLPPVVVDEAWMQRVKAAQPELPLQKLERYQGELGLSFYDASTLSALQPVATYFESVLEHTANAKGAANWVLNTVLREVSDPEAELDGFIVTPTSLGQLIDLVDRKEITGKIAKKVFGFMLETGDPPGQIIEREGLKPVRDSGEVEALIAGILADNPGQVAAYQGGKTKLFGFFMGQAMKASKGKADPAMVKALLGKMLSS